MKVKLDQKTLALLDEDTRHQDEMRQANSSQHQQQSGSEESSEDGGSELALKLEAAENRILQLEQNLRESRAAEQKIANCELLELEIQNLNIKIEKLESERALCEEGKAMAARAARASDLEKELHAANKLVSTLRESVKGKLLLEEQIYSMKQRYNLL